MTRRALLLHLLQEAGDRGLTTAEIIQAGVGSRYGARLLELRKEGWVVEAERVRDGSWRYRLVGGVESGRGVQPPSSGTHARQTRSTAALSAQEGLFTPPAIPHWRDVA